MKNLILLTALVFIFSKFSSAQILCILCYNQNDSISSNVNNLLQNGSFESGCINGSFCPNSQYYTCDIPGWTCTGGGTSTYVQDFDPAGAWYGSFLSEIVFGNKAIYLGNFYCNACSPNAGDISCVHDTDCTVMSLPSGYPSNTPDYGGTNGVSMFQTVSGLTVGNTYILEFWVGGEYDYGDSEGLFAVDVGFGDTLLRCKSTNIGDIGITYIIEFNATSSSQTIKFTNWGHICSFCTEVVLDNVRLYTLAELNPSVTVCTSVSSAPNFGVSDAKLCEKFCVNYFDSSTNNPTAWLWEFPGGNPSSSTDQNPANICYDTPGTYDVTLTTTNANGSSTTTFSNYITVYPTPPFPTISQVGYTLTSSIADAYQWQFNSNDIPGATNQSYTITQTGYYTVVVSDSNGCVNSTTEYVLISGIGDVTSNANISIHPNPSTGNFIIELFNQKIADDVSIDVVNTLGQKVFSSSEKISSASFKKEINLADVASGVYYIEIKTENDLANSYPYMMRQKVLITQ